MSHFVCPLICRWPWRRFCVLVPVKKAPESAGPLASLRDCDFGSLAWCYGSVTPGAPCVCALAVCPLAVTAAGCMVGARWRGHSVFTSGSVSTTKRGSLSPPTAWRRQGWGWGGGGWVLDPAPLLTGFEVEEVLSEMPQREEMFTLLMN